MLSGERSESAGVAGYVRIMRGFMANLGCLTANHKTLTFNFDEHCITCIEMERDKYKDALRSIRGHQEMIGGSLSKMGAIWHMADKALDDT